MTEVELCRHVIEWLQAEHWEVYQEVQVNPGGAVHDIVARRGPVIWILEAKLSLGLPVIQQAHAALHHANQVSVVTPFLKIRQSTRDKGWARWLCLHFGIGVMTVEDAGYIQNLSGRFFRPPKMWTDRIHACLLPDMQTGEFGEAGNDKGKRWTPYKYTMKAVKTFLAHNGPSTLKQIIDEVDHHYADQSAKASMAKALRTWEPWAGSRREGKKLLFFVKEEV